MESIEIVAFVLIRHWFDDRSLFENGACFELNLRMMARWISNSRVKFEDVGCLVGYSMLPIGRLDDEDDWSIRVKCCLARTRAMRRTSESEVLRLLFLIVRSVRRVQIRTRRLVSSFLVWCSFVEIRWLLKRALDGSDNWDLCWDYGTDKLRLSSRVRFNGGSFILSSCLSG